ncbi:MAG: ATPase [Bacteroidia bacterium]
MISAPFLVTKASGEQVPFQVEKLRESLLSAGATFSEVDTIIDTIERELTTGISTKKIYHRAFELLKKHSRASAAKYKLKRAVFELGPSGYPFERFVGEIFKMKGYQVQVGITLPGHCVTHEVDVLGRNGEEQFAFECKFGNTVGKKIDVKVALYVHSRFRDLERQWRKDPENEGLHFKGGIITNATFSADAIQYGICAGLTMVSWSFPKAGNLNHLVNQCRLYPITSLTYLTKSEKQHLIAKGIVLCRELAGREDLLLELRIPEARIRRALQELDDLCG